MCLLSCVFVYNDLIAKEKMYADRIVSLGPVVTEALYMLGAEDKIIADTIYCKRPAAAAKKEKIGTVTKVDIEKILSLEPDIVIATALSDPEQIERMRDLGIEIIIYGEQKNYSILCEQFIKLGKITGKEEEAESIIERTDSGIHTIIDKTRSLPKSRVFIQLGTKPLFTVKKDSLLNDLIDFAGGVNIALNTENGLFSREEVVSLDPEVIIIVDMGMNTDIEKKSWEIFQEMCAVKNDRIFVMDSYEICSPNPVSILGTLDKLAYYLHKGAYEKSSGQ